MTGYRSLQQLGRITHRQVNHKKELQTTEGVNDNLAESFFGLLRKMVDQANGISPTYLAEYAKEAAWRRSRNDLRASNSVKDLARICFNASFNCEIRVYTRGSRRRTYEQHSMERTRRMAFREH